MSESHGTCCEGRIKRQVARPLSENIKIKIYKTIILPVVLYGCKT
jgi:hypothetical protein